MQRLKVILSSLAAKILIAPVAWAYTLSTHAFLIQYYDVETHINAIDDAISGAEQWLTLSQYLLIGAPYLIGEHWILRAPAIVVYVLSAVVPALCLYFYVVDGVYRSRTDPVSAVSFDMFCVAVTAVYVFALLAPSRSAAAECGGQMD